MGRGTGGALCTLDSGSSQSPCRGKVWEKGTVTSIIGLKPKAVFQTPSLEELSSNLRPERPDISGLEGIIEITESNSHQPKAGMP